MIEVQTLLKDRSQASRAAAILARHLGPGDVVLLMGDLGAGKTYLVREILAHLGVDRRLVTSPTFAIVHTFKGKRFPICHADLYRLGPCSDITETGLLEYITDGQHLTFIEWGEYLSQEDKEGVRILELWIYFGAPEGNDEGRVIKLRAEDPEWKNRLLAIMNDFKEEGLIVEGTHT